MFATKSIFTPNIYGNTSAPLRAPPKEIRLHHGKPGRSLLIYDLFFFANAFVNDLAEPSLGGALVSQILNLFGDFETEFWGFGAILWVV